MSPFLKNMIMDLSSTSGMMFLLLQKCWISLDGKVIHLKPHCRIGGPIVLIDSSGLEVHWPVYTP
jgi:hypothetical protein